MAVYRKALFHRLFVFAGNICQSQIPIDRETLLLRVTGELCSVGVMRSPVSEPALETPTCSALAALLIRRRRRIPWTFSMLQSKGATGYGLHPGSNTTTFQPMPPGKVFRYVNGRLSDIPCSGIFRVSVANWFCGSVLLCLRFIEKKSELDVVFN